MTDKEIEFEEYKLIHKFAYPNTVLKKWITVDTFSNPFKDSWLWLMPVVEKIENRCEATVNIYGSVCYINREDFPQSLTEFYGETKVDATYKAVIFFIQWYNKNN